MFKEIKADCIEAFSFLTSELGYTVSGSSANKRGFHVAFKSATIGVQVAYEVRDPLTVMVFLLQDGEFPGSLGEITPQTTINRFDLRDIEAVQGRGRPSDQLQAF